MQEYKIFPNYKEKRYFYPIKKPAIFVGIFFVLTLISSKIASQREELIFSILIFVSCIKLYFVSNKYKYSLTVDSAKLNFSGRYKDKIIDNIDWQKKSIKNIYHTDDIHKKAMLLTLEFLNGTFEQITFLSHEYHILIKTLENYNYPVVYLKNKDLQKKNLEEEKNRIKLMIMVVIFGIIMILFSSVITIIKFF